MCNFSFRKAALAAAGGVLLCLVTTAGQSATPAATSTVIDNTQFTYGFIVCLNGKDKDIFYGARITYKVAE